MVAAYLLLTSILIGETPVEWSLTLDDSVIRQGDIVYGVAILKNTSQEALDLNALGYGFYTSIRDGNDTYPGHGSISTPLGARGAIRYVPRQPGGVVNRVIVVNPWASMKRNSRGQVKSDLAWPDQIKPVPLGGGGLIIETPTPSFAAESNPHRVMHRSCDLLKTRCPCAPAY